MTQLKFSRILLIVAAGIGAIATPLLASTPAVAAGCSPDPYNGVCVSPVTYRTTLRTQVQRTPKTGNVSRNIAPGTAVGVLCQINNGPTANGHTGHTWTAIAGGGWIYDMYLTTNKGSADGFAAGIRHCGAASTEAMAPNPARYPWQNQMGYVSDGHGYYQAECVSFAAWAVRTNGLPHVKSPDFLGNANVWTGAYVDAHPHVGDVAQWFAGRNGAGSVGHVAYVAAINSNGTVYLYEYNWNGFHNFGTRTVPASTPSRYLHY